MCGISAVVGAGDTGETQALLARMHAPIRHRGPDGEGFLVVEPDGPSRLASLNGSGTGPALAGLAFRRLKILDLSEAAAQPMGSPDGSLWIVFNGEIYNFRELRAELEGGGRRFATAGDTEVALAAFEAWGEKAFERLDGMWAIVILDLARRRLVASRDRFGIKPLYFRREGGRLLLASEIKQILAASSQRPRSRAPVVAKFLQGNRYPVLDETFFDGVFPVPPATWFETELDDPAGAPPAFRKYWDLAGAIRAAAAPGTYGEALEEFRGILAAAVRSHHVADVPIGSLLSGGLDSSTLTSLLAEIMRGEGRDCPTFSFGFRDRAPEVCELRYADALVRRDGLTNFETSLDADWVVENAGRVIRALDEPPLGLPALAQYRVFGLARAHGTTVVLDGEGSDEILAGYPYGQRLLLSDRLRRGRLADFGRELSAIARRESRSPLSVLRDSFGAPLARRLSRKREEPWLHAGWGAAPWVPLEASPDHGLLNRRLFFDVRWGNVPIVLGHTDRASMAHSVEARVPFFDRRLVEFAFSLPDDFKAG
ncbi:MAG TPA: asparagine synthase (glutamine-hydrolyzing), partial [Thermoanaerobaculia bacterium]|nr:asparagine synthase (glutamine-hydrolyzing) [Thermoanaerobaculia bacterium]